MYNNILVFKTKLKLNIEEAMVVTNAFNKHFNLTESIWMETESGIQYVKYEQPTRICFQELSKKLKDFQTDTAGVVDCIIFGEPSSNDGALYKFVKNEDANQELANECAIFTMKRALEYTEAHGVVDI